MNTPHSSSDQTPSLNRGAVSRFTLFVAAAVLSACTSPESNKGPSFDLREEQIKAWKAHQANMIRNSLDPQDNNLYLQEPDPQGPAYPESIVLSDGN